MDNRHCHHHHCHPHHCAAIAIAVTAPPKLSLRRHRHRCAATPPPFLPSLRPIAAPPLLRCHHNRCAATASAVVA
jgi:hypothetical protein